MNVHARIRTDEDTLSVRTHIRTHERTHTRTHTRTDSSSTIELQVGPYVILLEK